MSSRYRFFLQLLSDFADGVRDDGADGVPEGFLVTRLAGFFFGRAFLVRRWRRRQSFCGLRSFPPCAAASWAISASISFSRVRSFSVYSSDRRRTAKDRNEVYGRWRRRSGGRRGGGRPYGGRCDRRGWTSPFDQNGRGLRGEGSGLLSKRVFVAQRATNPSQISGDDKSKENSLSCRQNFARAWRSSGRTCRRNLKVTRTHACSVNFLDVSAEFIRKASFFGHKARIRADFCCGRWQDRRRSSVEQYARRSLELRHLRSAREAGQKDMNSPEGLVFFFEGLAESHR